MNKTLKLSISNAVTELATGISEGNMDLLKTQFDMKDEIWDEIVEIIEKYARSKFRTGLVKPPPFIDVELICDDENDNEETAETAVRIYKREVSERPGFTEFGVEMTLWHDSKQSDLTLLADVWMQGTEVKSVRYRLLEVM